MKKKYVTVEVNAEVSLEDFYLEDIFEYIIKLSSKGTKTDKKDILEFRRTLSLDPDLVSVNESKVDQWKDELWPQLKNKYTLEQLEKLI